MFDLSPTRSISFAILLFLALSGSTAFAALVSQDWKNPGDGLLTRDDQGLLWLNLNETNDMSFDSVTAELGEGGRFSGFRYATRLEVEGLWNSAGGNPDYYMPGWSTQNNGVYAVLAPYWGDPWCERVGCSPGEGYSYAFTGDYHRGDLIWTVIAYDLVPSLEWPTQDFFRSSHTVWYQDHQNWSIASALVMVSPVPLPAGAWLFGTALLGMIAISRGRKNRKKVCQASLG